jgi:hypothetical protein
MSPSINEFCKSFGKKKKKIKGEKQEEWFILNQACALTNKLNI